MEVNQEIDNSKVIKTAIEQGAFDPGKVPISSWTMEIEKVRMGLINTTCELIFTYNGKSDIKTAEKTQRGDIRLRTWDFIINLVWN